MMIDPDLVEALVASIPAGRIAASGDIGVLLSNVDPQQDQLPDPVPRDTIPAWAADNYPLRGLAETAVELVLLFRLPPNYYRVIPGGGSAMTVNWLTRERQRPWESIYPLGKDHFGIFPLSLRAQGVRPVEVDQREPKYLLEAEGIEFEVGSCKPLHPGPFAPTLRRQYLNIYELWGLI